MDLLADLDIIEQCFADIAKECPLTTLEEFYSTDEAHWRRHLQRCMENLSRLMLTHYMEKI